jgi:hypothetical protein
MNDRTTQNALRTFAALEAAGESAEASGKLEQAAELFEAAASIHRKIHAADQSRADRLMHRAGVLRDSTNAAPVPATPFAKEA